jgi:hypothetical protein
MYEKYRKDVEFILVYVREAHPTDGWQVPANQRAQVLLPSAKSIEEKEEHATVCTRKLDIKFTTLIDGMNNKVELDYAGWPDRLYFIAKDGSIAWKSGPGPAGFKPNELEAQIRMAIEHAH